MPMEMDALGAPPALTNAANAEIIMIIGRHSDSCQREAAVAGHMTDIYTVDDIVEHVDYLRYDRRQRELEKQLSDRLSAEKRFIFFHLITPMHAKKRTV